ncbi:ketosynthase chain-length factor [Streptomyces sp. C11-1]|uniref:Ketosynthase chain-length factor n=1 Tax=Streptomyces durocortorensis TaxID=2811104 RepID=A0ABY9W4L6_9ACTN|nr:ketosynthase chain-length factor [Streptomyces durocortorensis]WNF30943.1 ketosynthase chain-length factor [Streptomyces durocortorensis]
MSARALVTGLGIVAPTGLGIEDYWSATLAGRSAIGRVTHFDPTPYPSRLAGQVSGFDAAEHLPSRLLPQTDRMTRLALVGADWAFEDAGVVPADLPTYDIGVITASHSGGFEFGQNELRALWSKGGQYVSAYQSFAWFYAVNSGQISIRSGLRGPSSVVVSDQAGGLDAVAQARRQIRKGTSMVISGAVDASICPWGWVAQMAGGRLSTSDDPERAYLPFDDRAAGHVPGEGGALLVVEDAGHAKRRAAPRVYGEIAGHASTVDPRPGSDRAPTLQNAIQLALADADMVADDIGVVFADAAGLPDLDRAEAEAITKVFGPRGVPVTAPKTTTGRLYSGAAPLDLAAAFLSMRDQVVPPTAASTPARSYEIDLVTGAPRPAELRSALVLARGHGGFNSAMVVRGADHAALRPVGKDIP